jgi:hypothetical protein
VQNIGRLDSSRDHRSIDQSISICDVHLTNVGSTHLFCSYRYKFYNAQMGISSQIDLCRLKVPIETIAVISYDSNFQITQLLWLRELNSTLMKMLVL